MRCTPERVHFRQLCADRAALVGLLPTLQFDSKTEWWSWWWWWWYAAYLTGFLLTLWLSAGVWSELVEAPFAKALKELLADEVKQQKVSQADDPSAPPAAVLGRFRLLLPTALRVGLAFVVGVSILLLMYWLPSPTEDASMTDEPATNPAALANFTRMANAIATVVTNGTSGLPLRLGANVLQPAH